MSFLNKFKGLGRKDSTGDIDTLEQDRYDDAPGRHDAADLPLPGPGGTVALDVGSMQQTAQMDSSIITEAAPSEMAEFTEARIRATRIERIMIVHGRSLLHSVK